MANKNLSLTEIAYNKLRTDILSCVIEPGTIIAQSSLSAKYEIGKSPINSALQKLVQEGLVQSLPRVGYFVSPITVRDVNELFETLLIIEVNVAILTVKHSSDEDLEHIKTMADFSYVYKDQQSYFKFLEMNKDFHRQIALASGNSRLLDILTKTLDEFNRIFYLGLDIRDGAEEMREEHQNLAIALSNRDSERVTELTSQQINRSHGRVMEALSNRGLYHQSRGSLQDNIRLDKDGFDGVISATLFKDR
jgi:DNA-binding GntR family transcriptional regulator